MKKMTANPTVYPWDYDYFHQPKNKDFNAAFSSLQTRLDSTGGLDIIEKLNVLAYFLTAPASLLESVIDIIKVLPLDGNSQGDVRIRTLLLSRCIIADNHVSLDVLLKKGWPLNIFIYGDMTPLFLCAREYSDKCFEVLLNHGADASMISAGKTLDEYIISRCHQIEIESHGVERPLHMMRKMLTKYAVPHPDVKVADDAMRTNE